MSKLPIVINGEFDLSAAVKATCRFIEAAAPQQLVPITVGDETRLAYPLVFGPTKIHAWIGSDGEVFTKGWTLKDSLDGITQMLFVSAYCMNCLATYFVEHGIRQDEHCKYAYHMRGRDLDRNLLFSQHYSVGDVQAQVQMIEAQYGHALRAISVSAQN